MVFQLLDVLLVDLGITNDATIARDQGDTAGGAAAELIGNRISEGDRFTGRAFEKRLGGPGMPDQFRLDALLGRKAELVFEVDAGREPDAQDHQKGNRE